MNLKNSIEAAKSVSTSLCALANVISALGAADKTSQQHIPYRSSKFTRSLQVFYSLPSSHRVT